ncbi:MAG: M24 family metallopeptidase [Armatimonadota bacterium]|nr:M24 family metallopeptidase [Armatimonadota bacterium]
MTGVAPERLRQYRKESEKIARVLETCEAPDKAFSVPTEEFVRRQKAVEAALAGAGIPVGFVFSDEQYCGDVPYLGGNTNVSIEQVAGAIGENGFHVIAGLEGGYVAEQLAKRANAKVHKVEMLQLADEIYPIDAERLDEVLAETAGSKTVDKIGLLTPRQVIPSAIVQHLEQLVGKENVVDAQDIYFKIKYEKSDVEMALIRDANKVADAMIRAMLAVIRPGMLETQVAAWGAYVGLELGAERNGFPIMVGTGDANRTLIGPALNRPIQRGDWVHIGVAPKRDGLNSCLRRSLIAVEDPSEVTTEQRYWFDMVEGAYQTGYDAYVDVAQKGLPAKLQEQALVDYFAARSDEVSKRIGRQIALEMQKPYTGTHNSGYTECQEFYGAITLESDEPLGNQIVTMLDVALRGVGNMWDDVVIPGFDYLVIENTLGKFGTKVECFNKVPVNVQGLVGMVEM